MYIYYMYISIFYVTVSGNQNHQPIDGWVLNHPENRGTKFKSRADPNCVNFIAATHNVTQCCVWPPRACVHSRQHLDMLLMSQRIVLHQEESRSLRVWSDNRSEDFLLVPNSSQGSFSCDIEVCTTLQGYASLDHHWPTAKLVTQDDVTGSITFFFGAV